MIMVNGPYRTENLKSMMTSSNGTFSALLAICAGNSPVTGEFSAQRPVTRSFDVFFDLRLNKRLRKQSWGWCFETLSRPLWRHCVIISFIIAQVLLILVLFSAKCLLLIVIFRIAYSLSFCIPCTICPCILYIWLPPQAMHLPSEWTKSCHKPWSLVYT